MTTIATKTEVEARPSGLLARVGEYVEDLVAILEAGREAEYLLSLSDRALARRGLRRDEVVPHAFKRYLATR